MAGGQPAFLPPQYAPYPGKAQQRPPQQRPAQQRPVVARGAMPKAQPAREEPRPKAATVSASLAIPTPQELGVGGSARPTPAQTAQAVEVDWAATRKTLQQLGAVSFRLDQLSGGRARFSVWLPGADKPVQADSATEADAVRDCLAQARSRLAMKR